ncbi:ABC transporter permease [Desertibaculum subflavum]|uniref:ABC transporter permease n=1 Tax=Desertibaculum subflavum TaxID=2268458 RepID=UPI000E66E500
MVAQRLNAILDSDLWWSFTRSKVVVGAAIVTLLLFVAALIAPWISLQDPWDPGALQLINSRNPPVWIEGGTWEFPLGTDNQGRDMYSAILYGLRVSLVVGFLAVIFAMVLGILLGLASGYLGGMTDTVIMRVADVQLTFPAILIALLIGGIVRGVMTPADFEAVAVYVLVLSIGLSQWVQFARTVRGQTLVEKNKEYVQAARVIGLPARLIMLRHVLPNVMGPVLVIATINLAVAILTEATLSFLGVGVPATRPSLGTLIQIGNGFLFSGEWWIVIFPGITMAILVLAVNLLGDWLRDALNPKLR